MLQCQPTGCRKMHNSYSYLHTYLRQDLKYAMLTSNSVAKDDLEPLILLPPPPKSRHCRCSPLCLVYMVLETESNSYKY